MSILTTELQTLRIMRAVQDVVTAARSHTRAEERFRIEAIKPDPVPRATVESLYRQYVAFRTECDQLIAQALIDARAELDEYHQESYERAGAVVWRSMIREGRPDYEWPAEWLLDEIERSPWQNRLSHAPSR